MKKNIILVLFVIVILTSIYVTLTKICTEPYMRVGTSCCLDSNRNKICDLDEIIDFEVIKIIDNELANGKIPSNYFNYEPECAWDENNILCSGNLKFVGLWNITSIDNLKLGIKCLERGSNCLVGFDSIDIDPNMPLLKNKEYEIGCELNTRGDIRVELEIYDVYPTNIKLLNCDNSRELFSVGDIEIIEGEGIVLSNLKTSLSFEDIKHVSIYDIYKTLVEKYPKMCMTKRITYQTNWETGEYEPYESWENIFIPCKKVDDCIDAMAGIMTQYYTEEMIDNLLEDANSDDFKCENIMSY